MDLSQVTLSMMRYALAIKETGSFKSAAAREHISQSGLSMQVQKLEELLGVDLFDRSKKPILTTESGAIALKQMNVVLRETQQLAQVLNDESATSAGVGTCAGSVQPVARRAS